jgi:hypothetical protein
MNSWYTLHLYIETILTKTKIYHHNKYIQLSNNACHRVIVSPCALSIESQ